MKIEGQELTNAQKKALSILKENDYPNGITARIFAQKMWGDTNTNMFTTMKNTGNGATSGKGAWLCAGSYLAKLRKKGWIMYDDARFSLSFKGKEVLAAAK